MKRVAVLASGRGSNLAALVAAQETHDSYRIVLVASNVESSGALLSAAQAGIESVCVPSRGIPRHLHELSMLEAIESRSIDIVCLAGYMRVLGSVFLERFAGPTLNIHPSLLPAFPGMHAQRQALEAGAECSGATVHFVDSGVDTGPIVLQVVVPIEPTDTETGLSLRILEAEHRLYPQALDIVARGAYEVHDRVVRLLDRGENSL